MILTHDDYALQFGCCGIESANEYDTSLWRLQALGPSLAVPRSCCRLANFDQPRAYLNPEPLDSNLCQALEPHRHQGYRHVIVRMIILLPLPYHFFRNYLVNNRFGLFKINVVHVVLVIV